jgi:hypothetical protein
MNEGILNKINLQRLLFEEPHSPDDIFGKYLFDKTRSDISKLDKEKETRVEDSFREAFKHYLNDNWKGELSRIAPTVLKAIEDGLYSRILRPGTSTVYRVLAMKIPQALSILDMTEAELTAQETPNSIANYVLSPVGEYPIQGWTTDNSVLKGFMNFDSKKEVIISFRTTTANGKFFGAPGELARASGNDANIYEMETISYGPVKCDEVRWFHRKYIRPSRNTEFVPGVDNGKIYSYLAFETDETQ